MQDVTTQLAQSRRECQELHDRLRAAISYIRTLEAKIDLLEEERQDIRRVIGSVTPGPRPEWLMR